MMHVTVIFSGFLIGCYIGAHLFGLDRKQDE